MSSVNKAILVGNLGSDPELRTAPSGSKVANVSLATSSKRDGEEVTEWHRLVFFDKLADIASKYLHKGSKVYVEGKIQYRSWDKDDGTKGYMTEILVNQMQMLDGKAEKAEPASEPAPRTRKTRGTKADSDLPF